jgi:phage portal protein BeeE
VLERIAAHRGPPAQRNSYTIPLGLQEWVEMFTFGGIEYPIIRTTAGQLDEETLASTATAAYHQNGPVFALVVARMQVFSQIRFAWTRFEGGTPTDLFGTQALKILERPWRGGVTSDLLARMEVDVSLAGNAYIRRTSRDRLNRLRPDWVTVVLGSMEDAEHPGEAADVEVAGYLYRPGGPGGKGRQVVLFPEEVAHYAPIPDPDFNFLGQSWISPLIRDVSSDQAMTEHKRAFMVNAATPNMVIRFDPLVTPDQVQEFKAVAEEDQGGYWNAYKTLYLGGGADATVVGKDFQQLDFATTQGKGESRLAAAAGVPPSWVGFSEGLQGSALNAGNFNSARRRYGDGTMRHLWGNACASLEVLVPDPANAPGASLWYDTRNVPFLREDAKDAAEIQQTEASMIATLVKEGFEWKSVINAVRNHGDWTRLKHTGLWSVQLQPPMPEQQQALPAPGADGQPGRPTNGNGQVPAKSGGNPT